MIPMKILLLADQAEPSLWENLNKKKLEGVELILSCGDLPAEYLSFLTCFTYAPILYIHGNHDGRYEKKPPEGCICIEDTIYVHDGVRILGLGGCMRYSKGPHQYTERQMRRRVNKLRLRLWRSKGMDILLTHSPAYQLGDSDDLAHRGFQTFLDVLDRYKPRLMAHGHVHQSYQYNFKRIRKRGETQVINACGHVIIDLDIPKQAERKGILHLLKS